MLRYCSCNIDLLNVHVDAMQLSRRYCILAFYSDINAVARLCHAVFDMSADESYQLPSKGNDTCKKCINKFADSIRVFCSWLIGSLEKIIRSAKKSTGCFTREKLWTEYYRLQISTVFTEKWKSFLQTINTPTEAIFFQHLIRILFDNLLKDEFPVHEDSQRKDSDYSLTTEEENAICYVGEYVIASLKKKEGDEKLLAGLYSFIEKEANDTAAIPASAA